MYFFSALLTFLLYQIKCYELNKPRIISTHDGHLFTNRTIDLWNSLPDGIVTVPIVNCFKRISDKFLLYVHRSTLLLLPVALFDFTVSKVLLGGMFALTPVRQTSPCLASTFTVV